MKGEIIKLLAKEVKISGKEIENLIEIPPSDKLGDYSFPCFGLAKIEKKNPLEIAENLAEKLRKRIDKSGGISGIDFKAGYVNFFVDKKMLAENVLRSVGNWKSGKKCRIILEHTSVNPNASPHVGRARNSIIGDSIKRILEFKGHGVETHYYVNDVSKQIAMLALVFKPKDSFGNLLSEYVKISKKVEENPKLERKIFDLLNKFEREDRKTVALFKRIVNKALSGQRKIFASIGIEFDVFDYESSFLKEQDKLLKQFHEKGLLIDKHNRHILMQESLKGMMREPVLVLTRSDNTGLYPLRDIAYTIEKMKKGKNIVVLGEDQKLYFKQLTEALKLLKKQAPRVVHYSFVTIKGKGKMSARSGTGVLLEDFLKQVYDKAKKEINKRKTKGDPKKVAIAAVKYSMLRNDNNKGIVFDLDEALRFEGETGPYLLYSYARASSIIRKVKSNKKARVLDLKDEEIRLLKKLALFEEVVDRAYENLAPNLIANYVYELARLFNEFYHECPVRGSEEEGFRLKLVEAFRVVMKEGLGLLGIEVLEEM